MTSVQAVAQDADRVATLANALRLRLAAGSSLGASVASTVVRRLAGAMAPCARRELLARAESALHGCFADAPSEWLEEVLDDLLVGGDLDEQPALLEGRDDYPVLIFCCQPAFLCVGSRLHLVGVAPDDAPFLPDAVAEGVWSDGGLRFISTESEAELISKSDLLKRIGLRELSVGSWAGNTSSRTPEALLSQVRSMIRSNGFEENLVGLRWMSSSPEGGSYRQRWSESHNETDLAVARAPQAFGADAWYAVDCSGARPRFLKLPLNEFQDDRACDLAWRIRLALDAVQGASSRYKVSLNGDTATVSLNFPVPLRERRTLIHLGGRRAVESSGFRFEVPAESLDAARAVLSNTYFVEADR